MKETKQKECKKHGLTTYQKNVQNKWICLECRKENRLKHRHTMKDKIFEYKKRVSCEICGYNKSTWALEYHHLESETKDFNPATLSNMSYETATKELDKCIVICSNCRWELHEAEYKEIHT